MTAQTCPAPLDGGGAAVWRGGMTTVQLAGSLIERTRTEISARTTPNRFLDLLEAGEIPRARLGWLAGEEYRVVGSDRRSFALLASRFPQAPAGDMFLRLSVGEGRALRLLLDFASALGWSEKDLKAYDPKPWAQAYPSYLAWNAVYGTSSAVALAMLANLDEWGAYCRRAADALRGRYDLTEEAVGFFRYFAQPPPDFEDEATAAIAVGLDDGQDAVAAIRTALTLHAYEAGFWATLVEGLG
ncbi:MAG: transcriptional regulator [Streptosporangiaceae bacterium]|nr:transcriptional regulator [Streptosporangiaceae bacterium]